MFEKEKLNFPVIENRLCRLVLDDEDLADGIDETGILKILENFGVELGRDDVREKLPSKIWNLK